MATGMTPLNVSQSLVPIFSGQNYEFWRVKMRTFCISQDLWDLVDNGSTEERQNELKELYKKDTKALLMLQQAVSNAIFPRIANATKSHEAWIILKQEFNGDSKVTTVKRQTLRREFETLFMKNSESVQKFFSRVSVIINQMRIFGEDISDQKVVEKVLRSLSQKFDHVVIAIEESKDLSACSLNELMGSLLAHEQRINRSSEKNIEHAFLSKVEITNKSKNGEGTSQQRNAGRGGYRGRG
uniref:Uncharacterized protein LOC109506093 n=1 Tax=Elaeis guineensis var. tenera TaxID=51953 RepID=A0A8N4EP35_ELAGV|nr:uncharacterized protein LOC109506093 [Elaeis guineensis]XP_029116372.1 uncharacterized protein LOC109506093 [Elaeis guineensis]